MALGLKMRSEQVMGLHLEREDVLDRLGAMLRQERQHYSCKKQYPVSAEEALDDATRKAFSPACREKICEWMYRIVDHFKMDREVVLTAFNFIDRFLFNHSRCNTKIFKLLSTTALYVSSKLYYGNMFTVEHLVELSRSEFSEKHIEQMEVVLLRSLKWFVHPPTTKAVLRDVLSLLRPTVSSCILLQISEYANFLTDLSVYDKELAAESTSAIAFACLKTALDWIEDSELQDQREEITASVAEALELNGEKSIDGFIETRLLEVYSNTEECMHSLAETDFEDECGSPKRQRLEGERSPVNVAEFSTALVAEARY
jgi:hypothetical protein